MKSFSKVLEHSKSEVLESKRESALADRSRLISAIKRDMCVNDLSQCNESQKDKVRSMISEMWNAETGLNESGLNFVKLGEMPLNESSDDETVMKEIKRRIKSKESVVLGCVLSGKECPVLAEVKSEVESKIGRKVGNREFRKVVCAVVGEYVCKVINAYKL